MSGDRTRTIIDQSISAVSTAAGTRWPMLSNFIEVCVALYDQVMAMLSQARVAADNAVADAIGSVVSAAGINLPDPPPAPNPEAARTAADNARPTETTVEGGETPETASDPVAPPPPRTPERRLTAADFGVTD